ncbi:capsular biosynthesis protein [Ligilactobacillus salivarius]|uniref:capsular polysaccharide synthesis protein n=1 Tax=Ligilactobacillus salivarius TaxID=1624 RepID=UPI0011CAEA82|nr:capsular polysaccharide synthesis protein [Ligilactobacillus salivarius]TXJ77692.1 capsular biosynthesis protein [Ligilactobacillus salivarius]
MNHIRKFLKKHNLFDILKNYSKNHVLLLVIIEIIILGKSKTSLEIIRQIVEEKRYVRLKNIYREKALNIKSKIDNNKLKESAGNIIWVCWFQGEEEAPEIVKLCINSLKNNIKNRKVVVLNEKNYKNYIKFPEYIEDKVKKGYITKTHLSDLLRIELLTRYGGTWVDSTVLYTGSGQDEEVLESKLFMYQILKPGLDGHTLRISSWLMSSWSNNKILLLTKELLYEYWKENNYMYDYFLLHDFIELSIELYPEIWGNVAQYSSSTPHILQLKMFDTYNERIYKSIIKQTSFHKLTYKMDKEDICKENTYYKKLLSLN